MSPLDGFSLIFVQQKLHKILKKCLRKFLEPSEKPIVTYIDNSLEFGKSCEDFSWNHRTSTPHQSETNGIAVEAVRRVREETSAVLLQSGLDWTWWALILWNAIAICETSKTSWRIGKPSMKDDSDCQSRDRSFHLEPWQNIIRISMRDQSRLHLFGKKVLSGICPGYALIAEEIWKGDIQIAAELKKLDASEICPRRVNVKEVLISTKRRSVQILRNSRWYSKIVTRRLRIPRYHSKAETYRMERRFQWRTSTRIGRVSTDSTDRSR